MWDLVWSLSPFVLGALLGAAFARGKWSTVAVAATGVLLGFGIVLWAYYSSPPSAAGYPGCECEDFFIRSDRQKAAVRDRDRLRPWLAWVHRPKIAVVEDKLGLRALHGK